MYSFDFLFTLYNRTLPPKNAAELQKHIKEYEEISKQIKKASMYMRRDEERGGAVRDDIYVI